MARLFETATAGTVNACQSLTGCDTDDLLTFICYYSYSYNQLFLWTPRPTQAFFFCGSPRAGKNCFGFATSYDR